MIRTPVKRNKTTDKENNNLNPEEIVNLDETNDNLETVTVPTISSAPTTSSAPNIPSIPIISSTSIQSPAPIISLAQITPTISTQTTPSVQTLVTASIQPLVLPKSSKISTRLSTADNYVLTFSDPNIRNSTMQIKADNYQQPRNQEEIDDMNLFFNNLKTAVQEAQPIKSKIEGILKKRKITDIFDQNVRLSTIPTPSETSFMNYNPTPERVRTTTVRFIDQLNIPTTIEEISDSESSQINITVPNVNLVTQTQTQRNQLDQTGTITSSCQSTNNLNHSNRNSQRINNDSNNFQQFGSDEQTNVSHYIHTDTNTFYKTHDNPPPVYSCNPPPINPNLSWYSPQPNYSQEYYHPNAINHARDMPQPGITHSTRYTSLLQDTSNPNYTRPNNANYSQDNQSNTANYAREMPQPSITRITRPIRPTSFAQDFPNLNYNQSQLQPNYFDYQQPIRRNQNEPFVQPDRYPMPNRNNFPNNPIASNSSIETHSSPISIINPQHVHTQSIRSNQSIQNDLNTTSQLPIRKQFLNRLQTIPKFDGATHKELVDFIDICDTLYQSCMNEYEESEFYEQMALQLRGEARQ
ncbi:probable serine/threonine-protein kinase DDB_G0282963, partial [Sitodiplosis mosellana]|uniref:probable serine/threonine-protein kinase DDB_G0282963 n=1 Tax=Sitodiplosis mosellana TaxID=263140 RepID=UPI0024443B1F